LDDETEAIVSSVIDSAVLVHRALGAGLIESAYARALWLEFDARGMSFDSQYPIYASYRGERFIARRLDFLVESRVVVELKSVTRVEPIHVSQVVSYLRASKLRVGILLNFNTLQMKHGMRRVVL
jgi:GxxExxY protein